MKYRLSLLFVVVFFPVFSQSQKEKRSISKSQLINIYTIQELIPELPKNIYNYSASILENCYGTHNSSANNVCGKMLPGENNKGELSKEHLTLLHQCNVGCTLYIDVKYIEKEGENVKVKTESLKVIK